MFDQNGSGELLQHLKNLMHCPFCGSTYRGGSIKILAQMEHNYVARLGCNHCSNSVMASFMYDHDGSERLEGKDRHDIRFNEMMRYIEKGVVSDDDVMDFCKAIKESDGDFKKLFNVQKKGH